MRRIKSLGLGALMALALLAVPAGASASGGIEADEYPAVLHGTGKGILSLGGTGNTCESAFQVALDGPSDTVAAPPNWSSCLPRAVKANGCEFEFHPGSENSVDIGPSGCGPVTTTMGECTVTISSHSGLPAVYEEVGVGSKAKVKIVVDITLAYTKSGTFCTEKGAGTAKYIGQWEVSGRLNIGGNPVGIHTTDEGDFGSEGFFVAGKESEVEADQPRFEAKTYPAAVSGELEGKSQFTLSFGETTLKCGKATFGSGISGASSELPTDVTYGNCTVSLTGANSSLAMGACQIVFSTDNAGPPYVGDAELACDKESEALIASWSLGVLGKCTMTFPAQSLGAVSYENLGEGSSRTVSAEFKGSGIKYTWSQTGIGCARKTATGSATDAALTGEVNFRTLN